MIPTPPAEYDGPWKSAIEQRLELFLEFFFPRIHALIDWTQGYETLKTELQPDTGDSETGVLFSDQAFKVWKLGEPSTPAALILHTEFQNQYELDFEKRVFKYNVRYFLLWEIPIVSLALYGDESRTWKPDHFRYGLEEFSTQIAFATCKINAWERRWTELALAANPFAVLAMAHIRTKATTGNAMARFLDKKSLMEHLLSERFTPEVQSDYLRLMDWMMSLTPQLEEEFTMAVTEQREKQTIPWESPIDRILKAEGMAEGSISTLHEAILTTLALRFDNAPVPLKERIEACRDIATLRSLHQESVRAASLEEFVAEATILVSTTEASANGTPPH